MWLMVCIITLPGLSHFLLQLLASIMLISLFPSFCMLFLCHHIYSAIYLLLPPPLTTVLSYYFLPSFHSHLLGTAKKENYHYAIVDMYIESNLQPAMAFVVGTFSLGIVQVWLTCNRKMIVVVRMQGVETILYHEG